MAQIKAIEIPIKFKTSNLHMLHLSNVQHIRHCLAFYSCCPIPASTLTVCLEIHRHYRESFGRVTDRKAALAVRPCILVRLSLANYCPLLGYLLLTRPRTNDLRPRQLWTTLAKPNETKNFIVRWHKIFGWNSLFFF